jgi:glycosyltransferase involved in cell wall biosynthesis
MRMCIMKILFIPINRYNADSNEHIPNRLRLLSGENEIIGVELKSPPFVGIESLRGLITSLIYSFKVLFYTLGRRLDFDLVYAWDPFYSTLALLVAQLCGKPCVRDNAIVTSLHFSQMGTFKSRITTVFAWLAEKTFFRSLDLMIVLSEFDRNCYLNLGYNHSKVVVVPLSAEFRFSDQVTTNLTDLRNQLGLASEQKLLIFTGGRDYKPNLQAAVWINNILAPALADRYKDIRIIFTGAGPVPSYVHPISVFTGFIPNYFEYLHCSDILIAPLHPQSGVLVKVLDAMSCSKPVVVMENAVKGLPQMVDGENAMIATGDVDFIEKTCYLLDHPEYSHQMGVKARLMVGNYYSTRRISHELNQALGNCLKKKYGNTRD